MSGVTRWERSTGRVRRLLDRLSPAEEQPAARGEPGPRERTERVLIRDCADRQVVTVMGTLRTVTVRPRAGAPALEAELSDDSATLDVIWLGRRAIAGIEPGRRLIASGRVALHQGRPVLFNPKYELRPLGQE